MDYLKRIFYVLLSFTIAFNSFAGTLPTSSNTNLKILNKIMVRKVSKLIAQESVNPRSQDELRSIISKSIAKQFKKERKLVRKIQKKKNQKKAVKKLRAKLNKLVKTNAVYEELQSIEDDAELLRSFNKLASVQNEEQLVEAALERIESQGGFLAYLENIESSYKSQNNKGFWYTRTIDGILDINETLNILIILSFITGPIGFITDVISIAIILPVVYVFVRLEAL